MLDSRRALPPAPKRFWDPIANIQIYISSPDGAPFFLFIICMSRIYYLSCVIHRGRTCICARISAMPRGSDDCGPCFFMKIFLELPARLRESRLPELGCRVYPPSCCDCPSGVDPIPSPIGFGLRLPPPPLCVPGEIKGNRRKGRGQKHTNALLLPTISIQHGFERLITHVWGFGIRCSPMRHCCAKGHTRR